jgi:hypothetical protein
MQALVGMVGPSIRGLNGSINKIKFLTEHRDDNITSCTYLMPFTQSLWAENVVYGERTVSSAAVFGICNISQTLTQPLVLPARKQNTVK